MATPPGDPRVLLITGLWVPVVGRAPTDGETLAGRLAKAYPRANVAWHSWWTPVDVDALLAFGRVALIGHSFGGSVCVDVARRLERRGRRVEEMLLLDPVPTDVASRWTRSRIDVPANVGRARCVARTTRLFPRSKIARGNVENETRPIPHDDFLRAPEIVAIVEAVVRRFDAAA